MEIELIVDLCADLATATASALRRIVKPLNTRHLGAVMLCSVLVIGTLPVVGCSGATVAQNIVNWTPALESTAATVAAAVQILQPQDALLVQGALMGFDAAANLVRVQAQAYLANPNQTVLQTLQTGVVTFQQQVNASLLAAARIVDPQSQATILAALNAVATVINSMFALIGGIKGNTIAALATGATIALATTRRYRDEAQSVRIVAAHYGESEAAASIQVALAQRELAVAGF
jgi:hypothetical protein